MTRLAHPAERLAAGSSRLVRRITERTARWVREGRRGDGHPEATAEEAARRARIGRAVRFGLLLLAVYAAVRILRAVPALLWVLTATWTIAAWRLGPQPEKALPEADEETAPGPDREAVLTLLRDLIGDRPGVHLKEVLAHLQAEGQGEGWKVADVSARMAALGIPVESFRLPGVNPTKGVRRGAVIAPSPAPAEAASTTASTAA